MNNRPLFQTLGLYGLLAWIWAGYSYSGKEIVQKGLLWTAVGVGSVLLVLVLKSAWSAYRTWKAAKDSQPKTPRARTVHEDDAALEDLWRQARTKLAASPEYGASGRNLDLAALPLFLVVGPTACGKTSTLLNSGAEPQLLAGQTRADSGVLATAVGNFFLVNDALFVEIGGRLWEGDLDRFREFLTGFTNSRYGAWWRIPRSGTQKPEVRGVVLFSEIPQFAEKADPSKASLGAKRDHDRLHAICDALDATVPVYTIVTKCDGVTFFDDFFSRLPDSDVAQAVGAVVGSPSNGTAASADQAARRFTKSFNAVANCLSNRRVLHLSRESDHSRKPGIYEFPREFRRYRAGLIQFLSEVFRPNPLKASPQLRGFYFTATRMVEVSSLPAPATVATAAGSGTTEIFRADATSLFRPEATHIFRPAEAASGGPQGLRPKWIFAREIFHEILPNDQPMLATPPSVRRESTRQLVAIGGLAAASVASLTWVQSWWSNRQLVGDARAAIAAAASLDRPADGIVTTESLRRLDVLRAFTVRLEEAPPLRMRWGLSAGDALKEPVRKVYFERFGALVLGDLNRFVVDGLSALPTKPAPEDPFEPAYSELATHLKISGGSCPTDGAVVAGVLKSAARESGFATELSRQDLVDRQIDFYAASLQGPVPISIGENASAVVHAREYLAHLKSPERAYRTIREVVLGQLQGSLSLVATVPEYQQVLSGPATMPVLFSAKGQELFEKELKNPSHRAGADACVIGTARSQEASGDPDVEREIRRLYAEEYRAAWKQFLEKFQVVRYADVGDAVRRLEVLSSQRSPILGVLGFASSNTNYRDRAGDGGFFGTVRDKVGGVLGDKPVPSPLAEIPKASLAALTEAFQPVHTVVAPASERWVSEKNKPYLDSLADVRLGLLQIARGSGPTPDAAAHQAASAARDKALETVRQLAQDFQPIGTDGIDNVVRDFLEQPIRGASRFIITNPDKAVEGKLNSQLAALCAAMGPTLTKYPFSRTSRTDASLGEVAGLFAPQAGAVWKYQLESLADFVIRDGNKWVRKPDVPKPRISDSVLDLLNRAQQISNALYGGASGQLSLQYSLRPVSGSLTDQTSFEFNFDGRPAGFSKSNIIRKTFQWPPPAGVLNKATANVVMGSASYPFAKGTGLWAVFRIFADAEPRALDERTVEWTHIQPAGGERAPLNPPVRMEFVEFPGGVDLLNPSFFGGLECRGRAVQ